MKRTHWILGAAVSALVAGPGAAHAAWSKAWAIDWIEPAMYFGGKSENPDLKPNGLEPGSDCPEGGNYAKTGGPDWVKVLMRAGYTRDQAEWLRDPANPTRSPGNGQNQMAFRGKDRANVYINPTSTPESGDFKVVTGKIGYGLDLDGNKSNGFVSPDGKTRGIDNNFYRAMGCWKSYRGVTRFASGPVYHNDMMLNGSFTLVVVASGEGKDWRNDPNVSVAIYDSPDKLVKDGNGDVSADYTFRVRPNAKYEAVFKARTVNGRIVSTQPTEEFTLRNTGYDHDLNMVKAKIDFEITPDGKLNGIIGGYRPWFPIYVGWVNSRGAVSESLTWVELPDVYYNLRRYADYSPTGPGGEKTHISGAERIYGVPAFVMTPDGKSEMTQAVSLKGQAPPLQPQQANANPFRAGGIIDGLPTGGRPAVSQTEAQMTRPKPKLASN